MIVVRNLSEIHQISNIEIRELVQQRIDALHDDGFDIADLGCFLVVEPGDTIEAIDAQAGFPILSNRFTKACFGQPGFTPCFEILEEQPGLFAILFILSDDGAGVEVFVPKSEGVSPELLAMCQRYAIQGEL